MNRIDVGVIPYTTKRERCIMVLKVVVKYAISIGGIYILLHWAGPR